MQKSFTALGLLGGILCLYSQEVEWQKDIKSSTQDFLSNVSVTLDQQFLVSGSSIQPPKLSAVSTAGGGFQNNGYDFHLVKLDQNGEEVWEKYFGGKNHDFLTATTATLEGGFLLAGTSLSSGGLDKKGNSFGGSDIWLIKIAENGNEEWQRTIGTRANEEARTVIQSTDLDYFIAGSIDNDPSGYGSKDVWLLKLDKTGKPTKEMVIGGRGLDEVEKMIPTADGGALIGIYSRSGIYSENQNSKSVQSKKGNVQPSVAYLDQREKSAGKSNQKESSENLRNIPRQETFFTDESDTNVVSGSHKNSKTSTNNNSTKTNKHTSTSNPVTRNSYPKDTENYGEGDYWIIKLDKEGNIEWQKNYGGKGDDHIRTLELSETGYFVGGESRSENSGNKTAKSEEGTDVWIIGLDKNGNEQFQKSYTFGNRDILMSLNTIWNSKGKETKGFLLGGYTQAEGKKEKDDETFWMLHIDPNGEEVWRKHIEGESRKKEERLITAQMLGDGTYILAGTSAKELGKENWKIVKLGDQKLQDMIEKQEIRIYPNPVADYCYVEIGMEFKDATINLYDMSGRHLQSTATKNRVTKINTADLLQGAYLITIKTNTNKTANAKLIKK